jgi:ElaA protein
MSGLQWTYKKFEQLGPHELYDILKLRSKVFVVEQNCVYLDTDDKDQLSWHLYGSVNDEMVAYARIIPPGICYPQASIGRVVTDPSHRKYGYGKILMEIAIQKTYTQFNVDEIKIGAQLYLLSFYNGLGFKQVSPEYLEDGIPHIKMLLSK